MFGNENEITAAIFNQDLAESKDWQAAPNVRRRVVGSLDELPEASFDYVVGTAILCHDRFMQNLEALYRLLKPGGQILFFEQNLRKEDGPFPSGDKKTEDSSWKFFEG